MDSTLRPLLLRAFVNAVLLIGLLPLAWMCYLLQFQKQGTGGLAATVFNAAVLGVWCVVHSLTAREPFRRLMARLVGKDAVRAVYVILSGATFTLVLSLWQPLSGMVWNVEGTWYWILTFLFLACIAGVFFTARFIDAKEFMGVRVFVRRLSNKPPKPQIFCARGPYAYCRHPMYLFVVGCLWVGPVMTYGRFEFALLGSMYVFVAVFFEERNLREELGEVYDAYRANVPMWTPRLTPWKYEDGERSAGPLQESSPARCKNGTPMVLL